MILRAASWLHILIGMAGHIARKKNKRRTIRSIESQIKDLRSVGRPKHGWRDDLVGQQGAVWTRIAKNKKKMEDSGGGLLPAVKDTA